VDWWRDDIPGVGAKFKGTNTREKESWYTIARVVTYDPPKRFVFDVTYKKLFKVARWEFDVESAPGGCRVTETWTDHRSSFARKQSESDDFKRADYSKVSIRTTLEKLKASLREYRRLIRACSRHFTTLWDEL
jgi:hypothetical protein